MQLTGKITPDSLMKLEDYAKWRKAHKADIIEHRKLRSVQLGEHMTVQFESETDLNDAFFRFKQLADKKHDIFDEDLQALISEQSFEAEDEQILGHLFTIARKVAEMENITEGGFRTIVNTGAHSGQTVFHLHMHVIGGQRLRFPMG